MSARDPPWLTSGSVQCQHHGTPKAKGLPGSELFRQEGAALEKAPTIQTLVL